MTLKTYKALKILHNNPFITASRFASLYYVGKEYEYLFTAISNQGNGACAGKKAWLCAGSFLGRLYKEGVVRKTNPGVKPIKFALSLKGESAYNEETYKKNR